MRATDTGVPALAVLVAAILLAPILLNPFLPLEDLPNHVARRVISTAGEGPLSAYFETVPGPGTNAAVDLLWLFAGQYLTDAATLSRWTAGFALAGFVASVAILHRVFWGRWSAWPLAAALMAHNASFLWGFENFSVTAPLAILAIAAWVGFDRRGLPLRFATTAAAAVLLYLGHVLALLFFVIFVTGWELGKLRRGGLRNLRLWELGLLGALCLWHLWTTALAGPAGYGSATLFGGLGARIEVMLAPFGRPFSPPMLDGLRATAPLVWAAFAILLLAARRGIAGLSVRFAPGAVEALALTGLATLLMPAMLSGVAFTQVRFPHLFLGLCLAASDPHVAGVRLRRTLAILLVATLATRSLVFHLAARDYSADIADLERLATRVPAAARVLPVRGTEATRGALHWHSAAWLVPFAQAYVPTLFVSGSHGLALRPEWQRLSAPQPVSVPVELLDPQAGASITEGAAWGFLTQWEQDFTHLLTLAVDPAELPAGVTMTKIGREGRFVLYALGPSQ